MTKLVKNLIIGGTSTVTVTGGGVGIALALHKNKNNNGAEEVPQAIPVSSKTNEAQNGLHIKVDPKQGEVPKLIEQLVPELAPRLEPQIVPQKTPNLREKFGDESVINKFYGKKEASIPKDKSESEKITDKNAYKSHLDEIRNDKLQAAADKREAAKALKQMDAERNKEEAAKSDNFNNLKNTFEKNFGEVISQLDLPKDVKDNFLKQIKDKLSSIGNENQLKSVIDQLNKSIEDSIKTQFANYVSKTKQSLLKSIKGSTLSTAVKEDLAKQVETTFGNGDLTGYKQVDQLKNEFEEKINSLTRIGKEITDTFKQQGLQSINSGVFTPLVGGTNVFKGNAIDNLPINNHLIDLIKNSWNAAQVEVSAIPQGETGGQLSFKLIDSKGRVLNNGDAVINYFFPDKTTDKENAGRNMMMVNEQKAIEIAKAESGQEAANHAVSQLTKGNNGPQVIAGQLAAQEAKVAEYVAKQNQIYHQKEIDGRNEMAQHEKEAIDRAKENSQNEDLAKQAVSQITKGNNGPQVAAELLAAQEAKVAEYVAKQNQIYHQKEIDGRNMMMVNEQKAIEIAKAESGQEAANHAVSQLTKGNNGPQIAAELLAAQEAKVAEYVAKQNQIYHQKEIDGRNEMAQHETEAINKAKEDSRNEELNKLRSQSIETITNLADPLKINMDVYKKFIAEYTKNIKNTDLLNKQAYEAMIASFPKAIEDAKNQVVAKLVAESKERMISLVDGSTMTPDEKTEFKKWFVHYDFITDFGTVLTEIQDIEYDIKSDVLRSEKLSFVNQEVHKNIDPQLVAAWHNVATNPRTLINQIVLDLNNSAKTPEETLESFKQRATEVLNNALNLITARRSVDVLTKGNNGDQVAHELAVSQLKAVEDKIADYVAKQNAIYHQQEIDGRNEMAAHENAARNAAYAAYQTHLENLNRYKQAMITQIDAWVNNLGINDVTHIHLIEPIINQIKNAEEETEINEFMKNFNELLDKAVLEQFKAYVANAKQSLFNHIELANLTNELSATLVQIVVDLFAEGHIHTYEDVEAAKVRINQEVATIQLTSSNVLKAFEDVTTIALPQQMIDQLQSGKTLVFDATQFDQLPLDAKHIHEIETFWKTKEVHLFIENNEVSMYLFDASGYAMNQVAIEMPYSIATGSSTVNPAPSIYA